LEVKLDKGNIFAGKELGVGQKLSHPIVIGG
jgi:hypothetical protein